MTIEFDDEELEDFILLGKATSRPYLRWLSNRELRMGIEDAVRILSVVDNCSQLMNYRRLAYEHLRHDRKGQSSIRLGYKTKFRLIFEELENGIKINVLEISEHYGDK